MFKRDIPEGQFFDSMSSYWSEGECGQIFKDGMGRLREHFVWVRHADKTCTPPKKRITPEIFVEILAGMLRSIPAALDCATPAQVEAARERYRLSLQQDDAELGTTTLDVVPTLLTNRKTTSRKSGVSGLTLNKLRNSSSKRKGMGMADVAQSSQKAKRSRTSEQGTGRAEPSAAEADGSKDRSTTPSKHSVSKGKPRLKEVSQSPSGVKTRQGRSLRARGSRSSKNDSVLCMLLQPSSFSVPYHQSHPHFS